MPLRLFIYRLRARLTLIDMFPYNYQISLRPFLRARRGPFLINCLWAIDSDSPPHETFYAQPPSHNKQIFYFFPCFLCINNSRMFFVCRCCFRFSFFLSEWKLSLVTYIGGSRKKEEEEASRVYNSFSDVPCTKHKEEKRFSSSAGMCLIIQHDNFPLSIIPSLSLSFAASWATAAVCLRSKAAEGAQPTGFMLYGN